ncbi:amidase family protein, partial [Corynebacterium lipophiloflavum]
MTNYVIPSEGLIALPAHELAAKIQSGEVTSREVTQAFLDRIAETDAELGAFLHVSADAALAVADAVDAQVAAGQAPASALAGVPLALKDLLVTTDAPTTAASKLLEGYISPYDATVVTKLRDAGIPIIGKTNLDEFAMGSSGENSAYYPTKNPHDITRVPGGSGSGTAAALAAGQAPLGIGT